jgi:hypothetical protein
LALLGGMNQTRELYNKELKFNDSDNSSNDWFDKLYK